MEKGEDTCNGDSGGPIMYSSNNVLYIVSDFKIITNSLYFTITNQK